jgi:hypothetical protein
MTWRGILVANSYEPEELGEGDPIYVIFQREGSINKHGFMEISSFENFPKTAGRVRLGSGAVIFWTESVRPLILWQPKELLQLRNASASRSRWRSPARSTVDPRTLCPMYQRTRPAMFPPSEVAYRSRSARGILCPIPQLGFGEDLPQSTWRVIRGYGRRRRIPWPIRLRSEIAACQYFHGRPDIVTPYAHLLSTEWRQSVVARPWPT